MAEALRELKYKIVARLRDEGSGFSRNRNFDALNVPPGKAAHRIHKHLMGLERDVAAELQAGQQPEEILDVRWLDLDEATARDCLPEGEPGVFELQVRLRALKGRRTSFLNREEMGMLVEGSKIGEALAIVASAALEEAERKAG